MLKAKTLKASSPQKNNHFCLLYFDHTETATFPDQLAQPAKNMPFDHIHTGSLPMKRRYSVTHTVSHFTNEEKIQCDHTVGQFVRDGHLIMIHNMIQSAGLLVKNFDFDHVQTAR